MSARKVPKKFQFKKFGNVAIFKSRSLSNGLCKKVILNLDKPIKTALVNELLQPDDHHETQGSSKSMNNDSAQGNLLN